MELYHFVHELLATPDGIEVVLACGGRALLHVLTDARQQRSTDAAAGSSSTTTTALSRSSSLTDVATLVQRVSRMAESLATALARALEPVTTAAVSGVQRSSDEYAAFVANVLHRERSGVSLPLASSTSSISSLSTTALASTALASTERRSAEEEDDDVENEASEQEENNRKEERNGVDDDDDEDGDEEEDGDDDGCGSPEDDDDDDGGDDVDDDDDEGDDNGAPTEAIDRLRIRRSGNEPRGVTPARGTLSTRQQATTSSCSERCDLLLVPPPSASLSFPRHVIVDASGAVRVAPLDLNTLVPRGCCVVDAQGTRYPLPVRRRHALLTDAPVDLEPCKPPDPSRLATLIETATRDRERFLAAPVATRARLVYENALPNVEDDDDGLHRLSVEKDTTATASDHGRPSIRPTLAPLPYAVADADADTETEGDSEGGSERAFGCPLTPSLTFDSAFESGNLERAVQIGAFEFDLVLRRDLHTTSHTQQWFYFAVSPRVVPQTFRFNVVNLSKPDSLFNRGLQPVVYSLQDAATKRVGWRRAGDDVCYYATPFPRSPSSSSSPCSTGNSDCFYGLSFSLTLTNADDTYLVAHSYPYTLSDHRRHVQTLLRRSRRRRSGTTPTATATGSGTRALAPAVLQRSELCRTLGGRACELLTISEPSRSQSLSRTPTPRLAIVLTSRVHPGETQTSWILRGLLDFLVSDATVATLLRRLFEFVVVPVLNPDGVVLGHTRCALSGVDLNRQWHAPSAALHPTIYCAKQLVVRSLARRVVLFCDLHGHSRKKNVFLYGCDTKRRPNPKARAFAKALATHAAARRFVSLADCSFKVSRDKETTARVVLANELRLAWSFTLEASFGGASIGELQDVHFNTRHLQQVGRALGEALLAACVPDAALRDRLLTAIETEEDDGGASVDVVALADAAVREAAGVVDDEQTATATAVVVAKRNGGDAAATVLCW
ncbi:hypothetical protein PINS_up001801 [Pythium insidiosum]|nr:hypothetical protein PINS_up001801 [Pythium insidiosum]